MQRQRASALQCCGRQFSTQDISLIQEVVETCSGISRRELAHTVCELLDWRRMSGGLKARECQDLLGKLAVRGMLTLPEKKSAGCKAPRKQCTPEPQGQPYSALSGSVESFGPIEVCPVRTGRQRAKFRDMLSRYHYLGYAMPFGARIQYLVYVTLPRKELVGCVQFSSPAWRMKARDQWIGWDDATRGKRLQHIVNNSRFLVLANIRNLASTMLSSTIRRLSTDWKKQYGIEPYLLETLVDRRRFHGGCYRASNWIELGATSGRGRMDRTGGRHGAAVKTVLVYPLVKHAPRRLKDGR
jgi:hypothetical protein